MSNEESDPSTASDPGTLTNHKHKSEPLLAIENLSVHYPTKEGTVHAVRDISMNVSSGSNYGLVGESGSGKTTVAEAVLDLIPATATVECGGITFDGIDLRQATRPTIQRLLWEEIAYIPQDAMDALDPVMRVGNQIVQAIRKHRDVSKGSAKDRAREVFDIVGIKAGRIDEYPHQFSGGMRQRVVIAMAMALDPALIIADEPTTGLDVVVQDKILDNLSDVQERTDSSLLLITHDIGVVAELCDEVAILYGGTILERGRTVDVLNTPTNPYTMGLANSVPDLNNENDQLISIPGSPSKRYGNPEGCIFRERCPFADTECEKSHPDLYQHPETGQESACHFATDAATLRERARDPQTWDTWPDEDNSSTDVSNDALLRTEHLRTWFPVRQSLLDRLKGQASQYLKAVDGVSLSVRRGEVVGLAGESGCGKTTLGRTIIGLDEPTDGRIVFDGQELRDIDRGEQKAIRRRAQFVFQDPFDSLNPRQRVRDIVGEPLDIHDLVPSAGSRRAKIISTLEDVGLTPPTDFLDKRSHELSGGERQRVAIARALVLKPSLLICDEPASMLDVSLRVGLLNLLRRLAHNRGIGILYITHDLASLAYVADRLAIMYLGRLVELGPTDALISEPHHPYTAALLAASPHTDPTRKRDRLLLPGDPPDPVSLPEGCSFAPRCPHAEERCRSEDPSPTQATGDDHWKRCHFPMDANEDITDLL